MADEEMISISSEVYAQQQQESWNKYVLENKDLIDNLGHLLRGELKTPIEKEIGGNIVIVEQWVKPKFQKPPINEQGYYFTMLHLTKALDKSLATGNLHDYQAMRCVNQIMKAITNVYVIKKDEFELGTPAEIQALLINLMNTLITHMSKSIDMGLIRQLASQYSIQEQRISGNMPREERNIIG